MSEMLQVGCALVQMLGWLWVGEVGAERCRVGELGGDRGRRRRRFGSGELDLRDSHVKTERARCGRFGGSEMNGQMWREGCVQRCGQRERWTGRGWGMKVW